MSYQNTEAWEYLSRRWGSWFNIDGFKKITSLAVCVAAYMDCDPDDFHTFEKGVFWFHEFWLMVSKILDNTIIWDKYGWEIDDSKDKKSLKHKILLERKFDQPNMKKYMN